MAMTQDILSGDWQQLFQVGYDNVNFNLIEKHSDMNIWLKARSAKGFEGGDSVVRLYQMSRGSGARGVAGGLGGTSVTIPTYVAPNYEQATLYPFLSMGQIAFNGHKLERAKKNKWMFRDMFREASESFVDATIHSEGAHIFGDGTGTLCLIETSNTYAAGANIPVKDRDIATKTYKTYGGARYLIEGMQLRIGTAAEHANGTADYCVVTHVDPDDEVFQADRQVVVEADDIVTRGDVNGTEYNNVLSGLGLAIGDEDSVTTTYHGINRATAGNRRWSSFIKRGASNQLRPWRNALIEQALFQLKKNGPAGKDPTWAMFSDNSLIQVYIAEGEADYIKTDLATVKGHTTIAFQWGARKIPWQDVDTCPYNELIIGDYSTAQRLEWSDWAWWSGDGQVFRLVNSTTWAVCAFCHKEQELDVTNPRCWIRIEDLEVPTYTIN